MRIFLSFGNSYLIKTGLGDRFTHRILHIILIEDNVDPLERRFIIGHRVPLQWNSVHPLLMMVLLGKDNCKFA